MDRTDSQSGLRPTEMKAQAFTSGWYKLETSVVLDTSAYTTGTKLEELIQVMIPCHSPMPYMDSYHSLRHIWTSTFILHMPYMDFNIFSCHKLISFPIDVM